MARRSAAPGEGRRGGHLIVLQPGSTSLTLGEALPLRPVTKLGRAAQNTIVLDGNFISAEHATSTSPSKWATLPLAVSCHVISKL